jgi:hypothetical protein
VIPLQLILAAVVGWVHGQQQADFLATTIVRHDREPRVRSGGIFGHYDHVQHILGHVSLQQTSTYLNATLRGLHESMRNLDQSRPACKPLANKPARGLRPVRKQAPARNGNSFLH